jgi:hypothetical protein
MADSLLAFCGSARKESTQRRLIGLAKAVKTKAPNLQRWPDACSTSSILVL